MGYPVWIKFYLKIFHFVVKEDDEEERDEYVEFAARSFRTNWFFTSTKSQRNGLIYAKILDELKERASARGDKFTVTVNQMRTKFKKCVSQCKQATLTQKTATGIKRYQEDRGFGKWFNALFDMVKTRDSCQPEQALEPSTSSSSPPYPWKFSLWPWQCWWWSWEVSSQKVCEEREIW